jgi:Dolichyl-phosphate-mannose-protein mannosyltransferase
MMHNTYPPVSLMLKKRLPLIAVLCCFVAMRLPYLHALFYWDESWVYAPATIAMKTHGASLLPGAIDVSLSRGHPMLFPALFALWMSLFGTSHLAMHCGALVIAMSLLITVYEVCLSWFGARAALIGTILVATHFVFFADSTSVLPDVLISLLALTSIHFYCRDKFLPATISMSLLFFSKESTLVIGLVAGIDALLSFAKKNLPFAIAVKRCVTVAIPSVLIAGFFVMQKSKYGWFFYPEHTGDINIDPGHTFYWLRKAIDIVFIDENEYWIYLALLVVCIVVAIRQKNIRYAIIAMAIGAATLLRPSVPCTELEISALLLAFFLSLTFMAQCFDGAVSAKRPLLLFVAITVAYLYFSSINFFEGRYLMPVVVLSLIFAAALFDGMLSTLPKVYSPTVIVLLIGMRALYLAYDPNNVLKMPYERMDVQEAMVSYLERHQLYDSSMSVGSYVNYVHLTDPRAGFLHTSQTFPKASSSSFDRSTRYVIFNSEEMYDAGAYNDASHNSGYKMICRIHEDKEWAEIYQKK